VKVFDMHNAPILQYLKKHGQHLDAEIAVATGIPLQKVRMSLSDLSARGEISQCSVTRFNDGKPFVGMLCRVAGSIPPSTPGRKPGAKS
jgi:DNA-binding IclR family transcriptional regulator